MTRTATAAAPSTTAPPIPRPVTSRPAARWPATTEAGRVQALDWACGQGHYPGGPTSTPVRPTPAAVSARRRAGGRGWPWCSVSGTTGRVRAWFIGPEGADARRDGARRPAVGDVGGAPAALLDAPDDGSDEVRRWSSSPPPATGHPGRSRRRRERPGGRDRQDLAPRTDAVRTPDRAPLDLVGRGAELRVPASARHAVLPTTFSERARPMQQSPVEVADPRGLSARTSDDGRPAAARCLLDHFGGPPGTWGSRSWQPDHSTAAPGPGGDGRSHVRLGGGDGLPGDIRADRRRPRLGQPARRCGSTALPADDVPLLDEGLAVATPDTIAISAPGAGRRPRRSIQGDTPLTTVPLADGAGLRRRRAAAHGDPRYRIRRRTARLVAEAPVLSDAPVTQPAQPRAPAGAASRRRRRARRPGPAGRCRRRSGRCRTRSPTRPAGRRRRRGRAARPAARDGRRGRRGGSGADMGATLPAGQSRWTSRISSRSSPGATRMAPGTRPTSV